MKIEGTHIFAAQRALVWSLLHNPEIISQAIPGCERFDQVSPSEFMGSMHIAEGPFNGEYSGTIQISDHSFAEESSIQIKGNGPEGTIWAEGRISLTEQDGQTIFYYEGELIAHGSTVTNSPRLLRTTANALIRQFLAGIDRYIQIQTGIYTTENVDRSLRQRRSGTVEMREKIVEGKQNHRTTTIVLILFAILSLMTAGTIAIVVVLGRWGVRLFGQYVTEIAQDGRQNQDRASQS